VIRHHGVGQCLPESFDFDENCLCRVVSTALFHVVLTKRTFVADMSTLSLTKVHELSLSVELVFVICDLPCAASLAGIQPVRPRAQRTSP